LGFVVFWHKNVGTKAACKFFDEIDYRCQFHLHFKSSFIALFFCSFYVLTVWVCNFFFGGKKEIGIKAAHKMLVKLPAC